MKKQIFDALKAKFEGVSDSILSRIADKLAKTATTQEDVATSVEGVSFQQVLEAYGDSRATEAQESAVRNYEKKHGLKDGKQVSDGGDLKNEQQPNNSGSDMPVWAQALIDSNKQLTERLNQVEAERATTSRRQKLNTIIDKLPASFRKAYERIPVETLTEEEFDTLTSEITSEVDGINNEMNARGSVFGTPHNNKPKTPSAYGKEATDEEINAVVSKMNLNV